MYYESNFDLKPTSSVRETLERPSKVFKKIYSLIAGGLTPTERLQTEVALAILQAVNCKLRAAGVNNLVRLSVDDTDVYLDNQGLQSDLSYAITNFATSMQGQSMKLYNTFLLVLEHDLDGLKYIIDIAIKRRIKEGESPVQVTVSAVINEFQLSEGESEDELKERLKGVISNTESLKAIQKKYQALFSIFTNQLNEQLASISGLEGAPVEVKTQVMVPHSKDSKKPRYLSRSSSLHQGYCGFDDSTSYLWLWFFLMSDSASADDFESMHLVDETGGFLTDSYESYSEGIDPAEVTETSSGDGFSWMEDFSSGDADSGSSVDTRSTGGFWSDSSSGSSDTSSNCGSSCGSSCGGD